MRVSSLALLAIAAASPMLGGCQSIFGTSRSFNADISIPEQGDPAVYAASQMEQGRQALERQQFGLAIIAFRNARLAREHTAAACNGLAIAYAQIGRPDLAERYFRQAIAEAPSEPKYHVNLSRLHESLSNSQVQLEAPKAMESLRNASRASAALLLPGTSERSAIRIEQPAQKIIRVSPKEVRIEAQADSRRRALESQTMAQPVRRPNPTYPIRIELGESRPPVRVEQSTKEYPIRIEFGESKPTVDVKKPERQYPIRVSLAPSS